jgi:hypothetical protein
VLPIERVGSKDMKVSLTGKHTVKVLEPLAIYLDTLMKETDLSVATVPSCLVAYEAW